MGRPGSGALPPLTARPLGGLPGPTTHWLWVRGGCGRGDPSQTPQRALFRAGFARCGGGTRAPGGGRLLPGCWSPGVGRSPTPDCPPSGRAAGAHYPLAVGAGGCGRGDPSQTPQRALLRAGFASCGGGMRVPWGGASCLGVGRRGRALSHLRLPALWAGCPGPLATGCGCGGVRAWGPVTNPTARALSSWLCALWGRHEGARGWGASCLGVGRPGSGALPPPTARPLGGLLGTTTHWLWVRGGAGVGTHHLPHSALFRTGLVLWGRQEGARGGRLLPGCGASGVGRSPTPACPPSVRAAGAHYPLTVGAGGCGHGTRHKAHSARSCELALRAVGAVRGRPGGGRLLPGCGASGVWRSPTPDCPPSGRAAGAHYPLAVGAGGCGRRDPSPTPQRALFQAGFARCGGGMRVPRGGRLLPGCEASGVGRSPTPDSPPSGRAAGAHYPLAVGAGGCGRGDPSQTPQRALLRAGFASCGGGMRVPGGAPLAWVWGAGVGRSPTPDCPPSGRAAGAHYPLAVGAGGCGRGDPSPTPQRALSSWLCALWGRHERARGGGASCLGVGLPGSGALPPPTARPLGGLPGPTTHWLWVRGGAGMGPVTNPTARAVASWLCALWGRHEAARGGGASCLGVGRPGSGALPPPTARPLGGLPGPTTHWLWVRGGAGVGTVTNPTARILSSWLCALWGRHERARGGPLLPGCGVSGVGRSPTPDCPPSGRAAGAHYPLAVGAGGCGRGDRHQTNSARSCELALRAVWAA